MDDSGKLRRRAARLWWRAENLTVMECLGSAFPRTLRLENPDFEDLERRYAQRLVPVSEPAESSPFLIIKPEGLPFEDRIRRALEQRGARVVSEHAVFDRVRMQLSLLGVSSGESSGRGRRPLGEEPVPGPRLQRTFLRLEADRARFPLTYDSAKVLLLDGVKPDRIRRLKRHIRRRVGPICFVRVVWNGMSETVFSSYVHLPDPEHLAGEFAVVKEFLCSC